MPWFGKHCSCAVRTCLENGHSVVVTQCAFRLHFNIPRHGPIPDGKAIRRWLEALEDTGSTRRSRGSGDQKRRILRYYLSFYPYKITIVQELKPTDFENRRNCCQEMLNRILEPSTFFSSDEAHFHLSRSITLSEPHNLQKEVVARPCAEHTSNTTSLLSSCGDEHRLEPPSEKPITYLEKISLSDGTTWCQYHYLSTRYHEGWYQYSGYLVCVLEAVPTCTSIQITVYEVGKKGSLIWLEERKTFGHATTLPSVKNLDTAVDRRSLNVKWRNPAGLCNNTYYILHYNGFSTKSEKVQVGEQKIVVNQSGILGFEIRNIIADADYKICVSAVSEFADASKTCKNLLAEDLVRKFGSKFSSGTTSSLLDSDSDHHYTLSALEPGTEYCVGVQVSLGEASFLTPQHKINRTNSRHNSPTGIKMAAPTPPAASSTASSAVWNCVVASAPSPSTLTAWQQNVSTC
ncbi:Fibronectin type III [Trinorchestia longiramus]|nr:Fibronectin type III [Trinorchestia longiramus]